MLKDRSRAQLAGAWVAVVTMMMASSVFAGVPLTTSILELWFVAGVMPPAVMLLLWHPAPPITVAQLLHSVETPPKTERR